MRDDAKGEGVDLRRIGLELASLSLRDRHRVIGEMLKHLDTRSLDDLLTQVTRAREPDSRWEKVDKWMEDRLSKRSYEPHEIAEMCRHYHGMDQKMTPFLIRLARKIKTRLRVRGLRKTRSVVHRLEGKGKG